MLVLSVVAITTLNLWHYNPYPTEAISCLSWKSSTRRAKPRQQTHYQSRERYFYSRIELLIFWRNNNQFETWEFLQKSVSLRTNQRPDSGAISSYCIIWTSRKVDSLLIPFKAFNFNSFFRDESKWIIIFIRERWIPAILEAPATRGPPWPQLPRQQEGPHPRRPPRQSQRFSLPLHQKLQPPKQPKSRRLRIESTADPTVLLLLQNFFRNPVTWWGRRKLNQQKKKIQLTWRQMSQFSTHLLHQYGANQERNWNQQDLQKRKILLLQPVNPKNI